MNGNDCYQPEIITNSFFTLEKIIYHFNSTERIQLFLVAQNHSLQDLSFNNPPTPVHFCFNSKHFTLDASSVNAKITQGFRQSAGGNNI